MRELIREKHEKETQLRNYNSERTTEAVRIEYLSNEGSWMTRDNRAYNEDYIHKLEAITTKYEGMLVNTHSTIE